MNCSREDLLLYAVTDRKWLAPGERLADKVAEAVDGGATFVQLREKHLDRDAFVAEAREIQALCAARHVPFVINDDVSIAVEIGTVRANARDLTVDEGR